MFEPPSSNRQRVSQLVYVVLVSSWSYSNVYTTHTLLYLCIQLNALGHDARPHFLQCHRKLTGCANFRLLRELVFAYIYPCVAVSSTWPTIHVFYKQIIMQEKPDLAGAVGL